MRNQLKPIALCFLLAVVATFAPRFGTETVTAKPAVQTATVTVTENGYEPASITLKKGVPARITFIRKSAKGCGTEVVFKDYNIRRALPLNKPVVVALTPNKTGDFNFTCGMNMMRGTVVVQ